MRGDGAPPQFLAFPEETVFKNPVFDFIHDFALSGRDAREDICHILDKADQEAHCGCERQAAANFQTQSVSGLKRMQSRGHNNAFVHVESQHSKAILGRR